MIALVCGLAILAITAGGEVSPWYYLLGSFLVVAGILVEDF